MTKEEQYEIYCNVLNGNMSEEEMLYHKLKADDNGMVDLGLLMRRNKEKYPSLVTNIDQIEHDTCYNVVYYNRYNKQHELTYSIVSEYNSDYNVYNIYNDKIMFNVYGQSIIVITISKDIAYFTDEEDTNNLLLHLREKTKGDNNV